MLSFRHHIFACTYMCDARYYRAHSCYSNFEMSILSFHLKLYSFPQKTSFMCLSHFSIFRLKPFHPDCKSVYPSSESALAVARYQAFSRYPFSATADGLCYVTRGSRSWGHRPRAYRDTSTCIRGFCARDREWTARNIPKAKMEQQKAYPTRGFSSTTAIVQPQKEKALSFLCTPSSSLYRDSCNNETLITWTNFFSHVLYELSSGKHVIGTNAWKIFFYYLYCIFMRRNEICHILGFLL